MVLIWLILSPGMLKAATVELPLFLRTQILQNGLEQSLHLQTDGKAVLYQSGSSNFLHISQPVIYIDAGELHFRCNAAAGLGFESMGFLPPGVGWRGSIDLNLSLYVDQKWQLRYRIIDSAIFEADGSKALVSSFVWHLAKQYLHPILENFSLDLAMPRQEIIALLRASASPEDTRAVEEALATVQVGPLRVDVDGVVVPLLLTVADEPPRRFAFPEAQKPLSEKEMEGLQQVFEPLDAFLVFVVKTAGADFVTARQRGQLFDLLITSRYQLLSILAGELAVDAQDPLRVLFVDAWQQLKSIIESSDEPNVLIQEQLLRYMTFINAGDALLFLDAAAPQLGMHITTDGLRRLARMLNPDSIGDPLHFDWQIDPTLRDLFNFSPEPKEEASTVGGLLLELFIGTAHASEKVSQINPELVRRLDRWIPAPGELAEYKKLVARVLQSQAVEQIRIAGLDKHFAAIFQHLVPATALMESCWRQYVVKDGKIMYLRSNSGSVGIMQINQHVWRGFYSIEQLKWDVVYNIHAGVEILMHYYKDYGLKVAKKNGMREDAARAAYSAYNAGPRAARRFMKQDATSREKQVDSRLWNYFKTISTGGSVNLATCSVDKKAS